MDRNYWETIAGNYNEEIFDVFQNDKTGVIRKAIKSYAAANGSVTDIGCAVGKWLPFLSKHFATVMATDISAKNIALAKKKCSRLTNVQYHRADMSDPKLKILPSDLAVCINAILTDSLKKRNGFFKSLSKAVAKNGHLILVVPSLESAFYTNSIRHRWKIELPATKKNSLQATVSKLRNTEQGNLQIDGYATKHFVKEELQLLLEQEGFKVLAFKKVNYHWKTEFLRPPGWLKEPFPWDWLCIAEREETI